MDKYCRICRNTSCSNHGKEITFLGEGWKCNYIPVPTNADRIRAMSDEELADWIARTQIANIAEALEIVDLRWEQEVGMKDEVTKEALEWLKRPSEE